MNIRTRIEKLEDKTGAKALFCECRETPQTEIQYEGQNGVLPQGRKVPDFCGRCEKPIDKDILIIAFVESRIPKPVGAI